MIINCSKNQFNKYNNIQLMILIFFFLLLIKSIILNPIHQSLKFIDAKIQSYHQSQQKILQKKFTLTLQQQFNASHISLEFFNSIKIPSKRQSPVPIVIVTPSKIYNLFGQPIFTFPSLTSYSPQSEKSFNITQNPHQNLLKVELSGYRNQHLTILEYWDNNKIIVKGFQVTNYRNLSAKQQLIINKNKQQYPTFVLVYMKGKKSYWFGTKDGQIHIYRRNGTIQHIIKISKLSIRKLQKLNNFIIFQSQDKFGYINLSHNLTLTIMCEVPLGQIQSILIDQISTYDSNNKFFVKTNEGIYIYQLHSCKPKKYLQLPNSKTNVQILGKIILVDYIYGYYYYNISDNYRLNNLFLPNIKFPIQKILTFKKTQSLHYVVLLHKGKDNYPILSFYQMATADLNQQNSFTMRGFKAPVFIISISIVFYYSYKNRGKSDNNNIQHIKISKKGKKKNGEQLENIQQQIQNQIQKQTELEKNKGKFLIEQKNYKKDKPLEIQNKKNNKSIQEKKQQKLAEQLLQKLEKRKKQIQKFMMSQKISKKL